MAIKISQKSRHIQLRFLAVAAVIAASLPIRMTTNNVTAEACPDLRIIFARGSGATRYEDKNYQSFKSTIEAKLATTDLTYEFDDLDYPAVAVGINNLGVTLGALFGRGMTEEFGESVRIGAERLTIKVNSSTCSDTKFVVGGYSQGAIVVSRTLMSLSPEKLIYAATFGDPKLYLPEGRGFSPDACREQHLSDYRMYVPDCHTYQGMLGGFIPYRAEELIGKVGTWCNRHDFFCSPYLDMAQHSAYVADNLYEDASRVIFDKVVQEFGIESDLASPHNTAIVIDSTASMSDLIGKYKAEALRLARETLDSGGKVALYDYRDLDDPYSPKAHCDFSTCTLETFQAGLDEITTGGGGDRSESLLSASLHVMKSLEWQRGATKSLVVLTDADFLAPDRDGATLDEVVALSKTIDPVNFYVITTPENTDAYTELTTRTDGKVVTNLDELSLLTDYIMDRYDSLPRVEASNEELVLPTLTLDKVERSADGISADVSYTTDGVKTLVALNDAIVGITDQTEFTITDLDPTQENILTLVPMTEELRGEPISAVVNEAAVASKPNDSETPEASTPKPDDEQPGLGGSGLGGAHLPSLDGADNRLEPGVDFVPKAPDTGKI